MTEQIETEQTDTTVIVSRVVSHPLKSVWNEAVELVSACGVGIGHGR